MARTSQTIRNEEGLIYQDWCPKRNVNPEASAAVVAQYFQETWREDVTEERLEQAFDALKPHLTFLSPKEIEVRKQGAEDPELAKKLADWLETKQTFLEKEGENGFANFSELYQELRGRDNIQGLSNSCPASDWENRSAYQQVRYSCASTVALLKS